MAEGDDGKNAGYSLLSRSGEINTRRFIAALDYSLDQIKLREVYERIYRRTDFSFNKNGKQYSSRVINVTFKYKLAEFNRLASDTYVRRGIDGRRLEFQDCAALQNGKLVGIELGKPVENPLAENVLGKSFAFKEGVYKLVKNPKVVMTTAEIRNQLYAEGFYCGGIKYVRWKRSAGSARVGKCLFIDERLYDKMHEWEMCGLSVKENDEVDLAALESYISLTNSSIIDTMEIHPENILIVPDYESVFADDVISVKQVGQTLVAEPETREMRNSIFDGYGVLDASMFGQYSDRGMVLLRNLFFKCCCFNCNLQQWFADNGVTEISQLNGRTLATRIEDVKLITTPSSVKYLKFGTLEEWLSRLPTTFGVVKTDKPTHYFDGRMVLSHYQLLNSLRMSREEVEAFLQPTFDYINLLKSSPAAVRAHIKYPIETELEISPARSKSDIVYKMLGINDKFAETKLYYDFRSDLIRSITKNLRLGRVFINGNYETLLGNPMEFLLHSIGRWDGSSLLGLGNIHTIRFPYGVRLVGSRSPHIAPSNVWVPQNVADEQVDRYFNLTPEIVCINSIGENVLERLSGADFDSDGIMLTDNPVLVRAAIRDCGAFKIGVSAVEARKTPRRYNAGQQTDLDIKASNNLIGDLVNFGQELNTMLWDTLNRGGEMSGVAEIYNDISILNVMSQIEIDRCKKEFTLNSARELMRIRNKYERRDDGRLVKPNFFAAKDKGKGYYDSTRKHYRKHLTTMDFVQEYVNSFSRTRSGATKNAFLPFSSVVMTDDYIPRPSRTGKVRRVIALVRNNVAETSAIYADDSYTSEEKHMLASEIRQNLVEYIGNLSLSPNTMIALLLEIEKEENKDIRRHLFYTLFGYPNTSFYAVIRESSEPVGTLLPCEQNAQNSVQIFGEAYKIREQTVILDDGAGF